MKFDICFLIHVFANALYWNPTETSKLLNIIREYPASIVNNLKYYTSIKGPDLIASTVEIVLQQKYLIGILVYWYLTKRNGYIIELHLHPHQGRASPMSTPVLLHQGSFGASSLWALNKPHQSPGKKYGRQNKKLDPEKKEFWKFSRDPNALIDLPEIIDYVLRTTSNDKLNLIAHSLGAAQAFALLSSIETYNDKVKHLLALAPEVNFTHVRSNSAKMLTKSYPSMLKLLEKLHINELYLPKILSDSNLIRWTFVFMLGQTIMVAKSNRFGCFDLGENVNKIKYGQNFPPEYNVSKVMDGEALYFSLNHNVSVENVDDLENSLPNVAGQHQFRGKHFRHFDFFTSDYVEKDYQKLISKL